MITGRLKIQLGLLGEPLGTEREAGVLRAVRRFVGNTVGPAVATYAAQDRERAERLRQLTEVVLARLPSVPGDALRGGLGRRARAGL
ncbi:MAG: hypothetical protein ACLQUY_21535 [Ktedonobacterales bacterium]